jgi:hypothetical protein
MALIALIYLAGPLRSWDLLRILRFLRTYFCTRKLFRLGSLPPHVPAHGPDRGATVAVYLSANYTRATRQTTMATQGRVDVFPKDRRPCVSCGKQRCLSQPNR